jgi:hypothetical protein
MFVKSLLLALASVINLPAAMVAQPVTSVAHKAILSLARAIGVSEVQP